MFSNSTEEYTEVFVTKKAGKSLHIAGGIALAFSQLFAGDGVVSAQEKKPVPHAKEGKDVPQKTVEELLQSDGLGGSIHGSRAEGVFLFSCMGRVSLIKSVSR